MNRVAQLFNEAQEIRYEMEKVRKRFADLNGRYDATMSAMRDQIQIDYCRQLAGQPPGLAAADDTPLPPRAAEPGEVFDLGDAFAGGPARRGRRPGRCGADIVLALEDGPKSCSEIVARLLNENIHGESTVKANLRKLKLSGVIAQLPDGRYGLPED
jgi:hypothetical protein